MDPFWLVMSSATITTTAATPATAITTTSSTAVVAAHTTTQNLFGNVVGQLTKLATANVSCLSGNASIGTDFLGAVDTGVGLLVAMVGSNRDATLSSEAVSAVAAIDDGIVHLCGLAALQFESTSLSLSCFGGTGGGANSSRNGHGVIAETESVQFVTSADLGEGVSVAISTWAGLQELLEGGADDLLSDVQGVTIVMPGDGAQPGDISVDDAGQGYQLGISVATSSNSNSTNNTGSGFRQMISCQYFDRENATWSSRGVYLRGLKLETGSNGMETTVLCVSSHLTLFAVANNTEEATVLTKTFQKLQNRFSTIGHVDATESNTGDPNILVASIFGAVTLTVIFAVVAISERQRSRRDQTHDAQLVFVQTGSLTRPVIVGGSEFEAIMRGWLSPRDVFRLMALDVVGVCLCAAYYRASRCICFSVSAKL